MMKFKNIAFVSAFLLLVGSHRVAVAAVSGGDDNVVNGFSPAAVELIEIPEAIDSEGKRSFQTTGNARQEGKGSKSKEQVSVDIKESDVKQSAAVMSRKSMRENFRQLKKQLKDNPNSSPAADDMLLICAILCFFIPPLAIFLWENKNIGINFWISLILTLLFWFPGVVFSLIVVLTT
jgi:uncharacterized membrane protein YqaE (UPF0057 family)